MDRAPRRQAAIEGRDFPPALPPQRRPPTTTTRTTWATRPFRTPAGYRLLAFRVTADAALVLVATSGPPHWVPAESVLSERTARRWLAGCFGSAAVTLTD
jgi:hypothetical protein